MENILEIKNLSKKYDDFELKNVNIELPKGMIIGMILSYIVTFVMSKEFPNIEELISIGLGGILGIGVIEAIQIPCVYKWGAEKGRIQMVIVTALVALLVGGIIFIGEEANIQFQANNILEMLSKFLPLIFIGLTMIIYYVSYRAAYNIYAKKEI